MSLETKYREILADDQDLAVFMRNMSKFDRAFCEMMAEGLDFTLRFEVHGNGGRLNHCRVHSDGFDRPIGSKRTKPKTDIAKNSSVQ